ncbi:MAG: hypothetical protein PHO29_11585 [Acetobacterium sp.]|nr:hypothetical protein [Acetobacterium sp.]
MKTFGKMTIAFLYDDETDTITNEPILQSSEPDVSIDVLRRVYVALGMHLHRMFIDNRYDDSDTERIKAQHTELIQILEDEK